MERTDFTNINTTTKLSNFQVLNPDFTRCKCNVFYTGKNRNRSLITDEALQKLIERKGYANVPIVGHIKLNKQGKKIMGSHDRKIEISNDGIEEINECVAMGVVPLDANPRMEKIIGANGIEKEYFTVDVILWTHYFPELMETAYSDEVYFNHSMEINCLDTDYSDDGYIVINDFSLQALCMLGKYDNNCENAGTSDNSEPCFEDSRIRRFSINENEFKQNFELMLEKIKQFETGNAPVHNTNTKKEGDTNMDFKKFVENLSVVKIENTEDVKYTLLNVIDSKVFALDMEDYKPYGFDYAVTTENDTETLVIDFESKTEMSLSATEKITDENFEEFNIADVIATSANKIADAKTAENTSILETEFNKKVDELKASYDDLAEAYSVATKKLAEYETKEAQAKAEQHESDVNAIFEKYAEKLGKCSEFLVYKAKCVASEVTTDELNEKLTLMLGKYTMDTKTKQNFSYEPTVTKTNKVKETKSKYGHLLDRFID